MQTVHLAGIDMNLLVVLDAYAEAIFQDRFVCLVRRGHPLTRGKLTLERYCAASHILIAPGATKTFGVVDEALARMGKRRRGSWRQWLPRSAKTSWCRQSRPVRADVSDRGRV